MIKSINITELNTTNMLWYRCKKCCAFGTIKLDSAIVNVDNNGNIVNPESIKDIGCPKCSEPLFS